ncbi:hypothetical protein A4A49_64118 [Nicotiana attenuata]|uniref:Retroviral polymerase SH3-like domain-containing protein n=1 Tax=Nicotiana attenuata TaxID=49451 RepID=A0A314KWH8_NICAT|nr:hypothetical protein A4A49_64118 [Nicotiana attenuata]
MGYSKSTKGYVLYDLAAQTFFINRDVSFRETLFPFKFKKGRPLPLFSDGGLNCPILLDPVVDHIEGEAVIDDLEIAQFENVASPVPSAGVDHEADIPTTTNIPPVPEPDTEAVMEDLPVSKSAHEEIFFSDAMPSIESIELRKSVRTKKTPGWLKDFVTPVTNCASHISYPIQNSVNYTNISPAYKHFLTALTSVAEQRSFKEASADPR